MKKIINGKLYDTDTAKNVGQWSNGGGWGDFRHKEETLYLKRTGEYFLYGHGGPMTEYAHRDCGNMLTDGERITPMSESAAREWAEAKLDADEYAEIFGMPEE